MVNAVYAKSLIVGPVLGSLLVVDATDGLRVVEVAYRSANVVCTTSHDSAMVGCPAPRASPPGTRGCSSALRNANPTPTRLTTPAGRARFRRLPCVSSSSIAHSRVSAGVEAPDAGPDPEQHRGRGDVPPDQHRDLPRHEPRHCEDGDRTRGKSDEDPAECRLKLNQAFRYCRTARNVKRTMITTHAIPNRIAAADRCTWLTL